MTGKQSRSSIHIKERVKQIRSSSAFLWALSEDILDDPAPLLELAIAIILDKPIGIIALHGAKVSPALERVAAFVEHAKTQEEFDKATDNVLTALKQVINRIKESK